MGDTSDSLPQNQRNPHEEKEGALSVDRMEELKGTVDTFQFLGLPKELRDRVYLAIFNIKSPPLTEDELYELYEEEDDPDAWHGGWSEDEDCFEPLYVGRKYFRYKWDGAQCEYATYSAKRTPVPSLWHVPIIGHEARKTQLLHGIRLNLPDPKPDIPFDASFCWKGKLECLASSLQDLFGLQTTSEIKQVYMVTDFATMPDDTLQASIQKRNEEFCHRSDGSYHILSPPQVVNRSQLQLRLKDDGQSLSIYGQAKLQILHAQILQNFLRGWLATKASRPITRFDGVHLLEVADVLNRLMWAVPKGDLEVRFPTFVATLEDSEVAHQYEYSAHRDDDVVYQTWTGDFVPLDITIEHDDRLRCRYHVQMLANGWKHLIASVKIFDKCTPPQGDAAEEPAYFSPAWAYKIGHEFAQEHRIKMENGQAQHGLSGPE